MNVGSLHTLRSVSPTLVTVAMVIAIALLVGILAGSLGSFELLVIPAVVPLVFFLLLRPETFFLAWLFVSPLVAQYFNWRPLTTGVTLDRLVLVALTAVVVARAIASPRSRTYPAANTRILSLLLTLYLVGELIGYWRGVGTWTKLMAEYADRVALPIVALTLGLIFTLHYSDSYASRVLGTLKWVGISAIGLELLRRFAGFQTILYPFSSGSLEWQDVVGGRAVGEFANPAIFGAIVVLAFSVVAFDTGQQKAALVRWGIFAACTWAVAVSYTRSVWICFVFVLALFFIAGRQTLAGRQKRDSLVFLSVIVLTIPAMVLFVSSAALIDFVIRLSNTSTVQSRASLNGLMWQQFSGSPFFGAGAQWFDNSQHVLTTEIQNGVFMQSNLAAHNSILLMLADRGLLAFVPWFLILSYGLYASIVVYRKSTPKVQGIVYVFWSMMAIFLVTVNTIEVEFFSYFMDVFWTLLGIVIGLWWRGKQLAADGELAAQEAC